MPTEDYSNCQKCDGTELVNGRHCKRCNGTGSPTGFENESYADDSDLRDRRFELMGQTFTYHAMMTGNDEDQEVCDWVKNAKVGDVCDLWMTDLKRIA